MEAVCDSENKDEIKPVVKVTSQYCYCCGSNKRIFTAKGICICVSCAEEIYGEAIRKI